MIPNDLKSLKKISSRLKVVFKTISISLGGIVFIILFLEIFLRSEYSQYNVFGPFGDLPERLVPTINSKGFRDVDHSFDKPDSVVRVLFLGDSFTFGFSVADNEVYTNIFAELAGPTVEVINLSWPGWNTKNQLDVLTNWVGWNYINFMYSNDTLWNYSIPDLLKEYNNRGKNSLKNELDYLKEQYRKSSDKRIYELYSKYGLSGTDYLRKLFQLQNELSISSKTEPLGILYKPDVVVIGFVLNDVIPNEEQLLARNNLQIPFLIDLDVIRFLNHKLNRLHIKYIEPKPFSNTLKSYYDLENKNWKNYEEVLVKLAGVLKENNIIGIAVPLVTGCWDESTKWYRIIRNKFEAVGIKTVDLCPSFNEKFSTVSWSELQALPNDRHPGPEVHKFYATEIWKNLEPIVKNLHNN